MKNLMKILLFLAIIIAFASCEKNISYDIQAEKGDKGDPGLNGHSVSIYLDPITNVKISYWDMNSDSTFNMGDIILSEEPKEGIKITPVGECIEITEIIGTKETTHSVCNGDDGAVGPQGPQGDPGADGSNGTNGTDGTDGQDGTNGTDGTNGHDGKTIYVFPSYTDNCDKGDSDDAEEEGYVLRNTTLSRNHYDKNYHKVPNGTLVKWEYSQEQNPDSLMWFPKFKEPTAIDYFSMNVGSKRSWEVKTFFEHSDGTVTLAKTETIGLIAVFVYTNKDTYDEYVYTIDVNDISFQDVVRIGLLITKADNGPISVSDWENETFRADDIYIHRIKVIQ